MTIDSITEEVLQTFGDRKTPGRIDFVVDVATGVFYGVPKEVEHADFTPTIANGRGGFVPVQFRLSRIPEGYRVDRIVIGASSYEASFGVRHSGKELFAAAEMAKSLLGMSQLITDSGTKKEIVRSYERRSA